LYIERIKKNKGQNMKYKVTAYSNWEKPFSFIYFDLEEAKNKRAELKNYQYLVEIEEIEE